MSIARTRTDTHWHTQWRRRDAFLEDWQENFRTVIRRADVVLRPTARGMRTGVQMGLDGANPTRQLDALIHEVDPGTVTTIHRHSWDAIMMPEAGNGWIEIDGRRIDYKPWDGIVIPAWSWHRSGNDGDTVSRYVTWSSEPLLESMNLAVIEDAGHAPFETLAPLTAPLEPLDGDDPYAIRVNRLSASEARRRSQRLHVDYDEAELRVNPKGTRSKFLHDESIGNVTSGLTSAMLQFAPGYHQSMHRHPGEAWLYVIEGHGHSYIGHEETGGETFDWGPGDLVVVDHWLWHQHFNDDPVQPARIVRVHLFATLLETMRAAVYPLNLFEERLETAPEISSVEWPEDVRRPR